LEVLEVRQVTALHRTALAQVALRISQPLQLLYQGEEFWAVAVLSAKLLVFSATKIGLAHGIEATISLATTTSILSPAQVDGI
jgi:hypothetical protein